MAQSIDDLSVVVIDDAGPEPHAAELVQSFRDPRLLYLRNDGNLGLARNWNKCLDTAETELVTLLHADDELLPDYAERMIAAATRWPNAAAFFCQARIIDADGRGVFSFPDLIKQFLIPSMRNPVFVHGELGLTRLLRGNFIMCPTICYRTSQLRGRRFDPRWRMVLDLDFTARLLATEETLVGLPDVLYSYRRHSANQTSLLTASLVRFEEEVALHNELARQCRERKWRRAALAARQKTMIQLNLVYCLLQDLMRGRVSQAWIKAQFLHTKTLCW